MKLLYFKSSLGNFGDDLNPWLWPRVFPGRVDDNLPWFAGIGTILDERIPLTEPVVVFGSGFRPPGPRTDVAARWDIRFVRGPLSSNRLGGVRWITDPAVLLRNELPADTPGGKRGDVAFVPWYRNHLPLWRFACSLAGVRLINVRENVESVVEQIRRSRLTLCESLHGAIVSDTFRVPWLRVRSMSHLLEGSVSEFKWEDWAQSMQVRLQTAELPMLRLKRAFDLPRAVLGLRRLARMSGQLSPEGLVDEKIQEVNREIAHLSE